MGYDLSEKIEYGYAGRRYGDISSTKCGFMTLMQSRRSVVLWRDSKNADYLPLALRDLYHCAQVALSTAIGRDAVECINGFEKVKSFPDLLKQSQRPSSMMGSHLVILPRSKKALYDIISFRNEFEHNLPCYTHVVLDTLLISAMSFALDICETLFLHNSLGPHFNPHQLSETEVAIEFIRKTIGYRDKISLVGH